MDLLEFLFPGLLESENENQPSWEALQWPWDILGKESGLESQIQELTGEESSIFIHPSAKIGEQVKLEGPIFIGPNVEIRHSAYIRKGVWLCSDVVVGHSSEIKNSVLLPGAKAPHFNYVGDSILGMDVNIGAGVKLSNVRNDRREVFVRLPGGERINTGLYKMGALIGDGCQLGCNTVTNPGAIILPGTMIPPNGTIS